MFCVAAAERGGMVFVWLGGASVLQLLRVPCRPIWSGSFQASVGRTSGLQDMLHWALFLFRVRLEEDLH